jgi:hypothetical protein
MKARRKVDPEKQYFVALDAFFKNGYFVLIDNIQAESPEQMVVINVFLPFEGDSGLSVILSKALMLADDDKITDTTITRQININTAATG